MGMERPDATGLRKSGKALEESFFAKENELLLKKMREKAEAAERRDALKEALNLKNDAVIDALVELDLAPETVAAFGIVPLVEVAWADGSIQAKERDAILAAAKESGIEPGSANYQLLDSWLQHKPGDELMDVWKAYAHALHESLSADVADALKQRMIARTRAVAEAAGGFLGLGAISKSEKAILDELEQAFA